MKDRKKEGGLQRACEKVVRRLIVEFFEKFHNAHNFLQSKTGLLLTTYAIPIENVWFSKIVAVTLLIRQVFLQLNNCPFPDFLGPVGI